MTEKQLQKQREKEEKAAAKLRQEIERTEAMMSYERRFSDREYICGIDEVGRGPLAGPVVACAVILPKELGDQLLRYRILFHVVSPHLFMDFQID